MSNYIPHPLEAPPFLNIPAVPEQVLATQEINRRLNVEREKWIRRALDGAMDAQRLRRQLRRLLKYTRALKEFSDSQAEALGSCHK